MKPWSIVNDALERNDTACRRARLGSEPQLSRSENMKLTRRKLAAVLTTGVALAQTPSAPLATSGDLLQAARKRNEANAAALKAEQIPMATEPAFQFKV